MDQRSLEALVASFVRGALQGQATTEAPIHAAIQPARTEALGMVHVSEITGVAVACQTETPEKADATTQTNPFLEYERPLGFDVATQWEDLSISTRMVVPPRRQTSSLWTGVPLAVPGNSTGSYGRHSLPSLSSGSHRRSSDRESNSAHLLPWEVEDMEPSLDRQRRQSPPASPPKRRRSPVKKRVASPPHSPVPKKRGRPKKNTTGVTCRLCEEPIASMHVSPCNHYFCERCISGWMEEWNHCPKCAASPIEVSKANF